MSPLFTLIIPHYNIPDLLVRCLRSIPVRPDLQVIVVDDCSPDFEQYQQQYPELARPYLELYRTPQGGSAGRARNVGLAHAQGQYLIFSDADDYFTDDFGQILDDYARAETFDIAFFRATSCHCYTRKPADRADVLNDYIDLYLQGQDPQAQHLRYLFGEPWCKMVRRALVIEHDIRFYEVPIHDDMPFGYLIGYHAQRILVDTRVLYCATFRLGSVSLNNCDANVLTRMKLFAVSEHFFLDHQLSVRTYLHYSELRRLLRDGRFRLFTQAWQVLRGQRFSACHIVKYCLLAALHDLKWRLRS